MAKSGPGKTRDDGVLWIYEGPNRDKLREALFRICSKIVFSGKFVYAGISCKSRITTSRCYSGAPSDFENSDAVDSIFNPSRESDKKWIVCSTAAVKLFNTAIYSAGLTEKQRNEVFPLSSTACSPDDLLLLGNIVEMKNAWSLLFASSQGRYKKIEGDDATISSFKDSVLRSETAEEKEAEKKRRLAAPTRKQRAAAALKSLEALRD